MNFTLKTRECRADGIFSDFVGEGGQVFVTLEHAYPLANGGYGPKLERGKKYVCKRRKSPHFGYDLFQIMDVPGHDFMEIHVGCFNPDSDGCVCVGEAEQQLPGMDKMIVKSREAFQRFMAIQDGVDTWTLTVE